MAFLLLSSKNVKHTITNGQKKQTHMFNGKIGILALSGTLEDIIE